MAAIDKIYGDFRDWVDLTAWAYAHSKSVFNDLYPAPPCDGGRYPLAHLSHEQDLILLWRCPIPFVRRYLAEQCGLKTRWYHKLFLTKL